MWVFESSEEVVKMIELALICMVLLAIVAIPRLLVLLLLLAVIDALWRSFYYRMVSWFWLIVAIILLKLLLF